MQFGDIMRELLEERNLTQKQLAEDLNMPPVTLGNYIRNKREPDLEMLKTLSGYFQVSIDYLLDNSVQGNSMFSREEQKLVYLFRSLNDDQKAFYLEMGNSLAKQNQKKNKN